MMGSKALAGMDDADRSSRGCGSVIQHTGGNGQGMKGRCEELREGELPEGTGMQRTVSCVSERADPESKTSEEFWEDES